MNFKLLEYVGKIKIILLLEFKEFRKKKVL